MLFRISNLCRGEKMPKGKVEGFLIKPNVVELQKITMHLFLTPEEVWQLGAYGILSGVGPGQVCSEALRKILKGDRKFKDILNNMTPEEKNKIMKQIEENGKKKGKKK